MDTAAMPDAGPSSVPAHLLAACARHGDRPAQAWRAPDGTWATLSYQHLAATVRRTAAWLAARGVQAGDRVLLMAATAPEWVQVDLAVQLLGAVTVPVFPSLDPPQVAYMAGHAEARWAVVDGPAARDAMPSGLTVWDWTQDDWPTADDGQAPLAPPPAAAAGPQDLATIVYTSGTTAHSRGVMLTHGNLLANMEGIDDAMQGPDGPVVRPGERYLAFLPLSHIFERTCHLWLLSQGATVFYSAPERMAEDARQVHPTFMLAVPRLLERVMEVVRREAASPVHRFVLDRAEVAAQAAGRSPDGRRPLAWPLWNRLVYARIRQALGGSLHTIVSGGAALAPDLNAFFTGMGLRVLEGYGLTEAAPVVSVNRVGRVHCGTVGLPLANVEVRLGADGEILCRGPNVMAGYWHDPDASRAAVDADGWLHTGDVGLFEADGCLRVVDRKKDIIVLSTGKKVVPTAVEQALCRSPYIAQAVLVGEGRKYAACLLGVDPAIVGTWGAAHRIRGTWAEVAASPAWREFLDREVARTTAGLAPFERPKRWALLPALLTEATGDLTPSLKVKRRAVLTRYADLVDSLYP